MSILTLEPITTDEEKEMPLSNAETAETTRSLFTHQTGQALVALGTLFKHVPPFNESVGRTTSENLISLGKKLQGMK